MLKPGKYTRSRVNKQIYVFDPRDLLLPHMDVIYIDEGGNITGLPPEASEPMEPASTVMVATAEAEYNTDDRKVLVGLYKKKYGRKPHARMSVERLRQMIASDGNDPSPVDH